MKMKWTRRMLTVAGAAGLAGCVVVPTRRGPVLVGPPLPPPVVVAPAPVAVAPAPAPPPEVEVVPASPYPDDPAYVWTPGVYFYDAYGVRHWRHGYWHRR
jgi:hypothetical protein